MRTGASSGGDEPRTLLSRFGFQDGDLKTPQHDEMMLWLDANHLAIAERVVGRSMSGRLATLGEMDAARAEFLGEYGYERMLESAWPALTAESPSIGAAVTKVTWEVPVRSGAYTVGFVDMVVRWEARSSLHLSYSRTTGAVWSEPTDGGRIAFEVKSSIPSLGELIRQIRMYEPHTKARFVVVCADDRFAEPLRRQGIEFVRYTP